MGYPTFSTSGVVSPFVRKKNPCFSREVLSSNHNGEIIAQFNSLVKSPKPIPTSVEKLTGITNEALLNAPSFPEVFRQFLDFCKGTVLVTQAGYEYDIHMLENHCRSYNLPLCNNPIIDTKVLFASIHREINEIISTNFLINYYFINDKDIARHDALSDSILISRFFALILKEYEVNNISDFIIEEMKIKRFLLPI